MFAGGAVAAGDAANAGGAANGGGAVDTVDAADAADDADAADAAADVDVDAADADDAAGCTEVRRVTRRLAAPRRQQPRQLKSVLRQPAPSRGTPRGTRTTPQRSSEVNSGATQFAGMFT